MMGLVADAGLSQNEAQRLLPTALLVYWPHTLQIQAVPFRGVDLGAF